MKTKNIIILICVIAIFAGCAIAVINIYKSKFLRFVPVDVLTHLKAIPAYENILQKDTDNYDALWKIAHYYSEAGLLEDKKMMSKRYLSKAASYAQRAVEVDDKRYEGHLYLAESLGLLLKHEGPVDRVRYVRKIKKEAERAIELNPSHYRGYLILGIWHRKVFEASSLEKSLARIFLGGIPKTSLEEAKAALKKSIELRPNFPKTHYELGLLYMTLGDKEGAIEELKKAIACPITNKKEEEVKEEAILLLKQFSNR